MSRECEIRFPISDPRLIKSRFSAFSNPSKSNFVDSYFDDEFYTLTTRDWWLRQRNARWELKYRKNEEKRERSSTSGETILWEYLEERSKPKIDQMVDSTRTTPIGCFASIATHRESFVFSQEEVRADIDITTFDYAVGEIEYIGKQSLPSSEIQCVFSLLFLITVFINRNVEEF